MSDREYIKDVVLGSAGALLVFLILICFICSSCRLFKEVEKSKTETEKVDTVKEGSSKTDSSGTKTENIKETTYYPQPIIVPGESKVVFVPQSVREVEKAEQAQVIQDTSWKEEIKSLKSLLEEKQTETKVKVGPTFLEWILIAGLGLLILKNFLPFKIIKS
jgi:hypothetical protein